jgi:hypothetical protein
MMGGNQGGQQHFLITKTSKTHNNLWETKTKWVVHNKCSCSLKIWEDKVNSLITKEEELGVDHNNTDKNNKWVVQVVSNNQ